jgi:NAD(P)-dependent dehydrogenase (short-subunit alcohol dehydrogenase family)
MNTTVHNDTHSVVLITGASSGFGRLTAEALAKAGHTVYASMRNTTGRNAAVVEQMADFAKQNAVDLRTVDMDVQSQESIDAAVAKILADAGRIDVLVHNAGHMAFGPAEAFTPEQYTQLYDVNVLSTQRVNRAVLPQLRKQGRGLLVWVSSSSVAGGTPPYLAPYFAAKAAMDAVAVQYARELSRWGIETSIVVPGAFTRGTNHFGRRGSRGRVRARPVRGIRRAGADRIRRDRAGRCRREPGCRSDGGDRGCAVRQAPVPRARRSHPGRRRCSVRGDGSGAGGDVAAGGIGGFAGAGGGLRALVFFYRGAAHPPSPSGVPTVVRTSMDPCLRGDDG